MKYIIFLFFILFTKFSYAVEYYVAYGFSKATMPLNGIWYHKNKDFPAYTQDMTNMSTMIGIRKSINKNLRWNLGITDLGSYHLDAWATPADSNYDPKKQACIGQCLPLVNFKTTGNLYGIVPSLELHNNHAGLEIGPFIYRSRFRLDAPNWYSVSGSPGNYVYNEKNIIPIHTDNSEWQLGSFIGFSLSDGSWSLRYLMMFTKQGFDREENSGWVPNWRRHNLLLIQKTF